MSRVSIEINAILQHTENMCAHDLERLRKRLALRGPQRNPDCWACEHEEEKEQFVEKHHRKNKS